MKNLSKLIVFYGILQATSSNNECPEIVDSTTWAGRRLRGESTLNTPVRYVVIHRTATPNCNKRNECSRIIRNSLNGNDNNRPSRIGGFNFLVGGDGFVYRARGWDTEGSNAPEYNRRSVGIALIGRFESQPPSREQVRATKRLIECGVKRGKIRRNYRLIGHLQISSTDCPGSILYDRIKEWPNWFSNDGDYGEDEDMEY
ncbi:peptidoglycan-recognition protein SB1-like isoform X2 [Ischnura elegans]|uniref:peptidoglycan-recognition protein SB1-like isoform X2 n=1 Tax=Ischnura elegans TaxID=197161 RepID=UPI001ED896CA|nr:peptidoglycan-recognition protein SB1-like isoform X2 [Ischnura elegans]